MPSSCGLVFSVVAHPSKDGVVTVPFSFCKKQPHKSILASFFPETPPISAFLFTLHQFAALNPEKTRLHQIEALRDSVRGHFEANGFRKDLKNEKLRCKGLRLVAVVVWRAKNRTVLYLLTVERPLEGEVGLAGDCCGSGCSVAKISGVLRLGTLDRRENSCRRAGPALPEATDFGPVIRDKVEIPRNFQDQPRIRRRFQNRGREIQDRRYP